MIDIETMSTSSNSAIVSIGACFFDENGVSETRFYETATLSSSIKRGFDVDGLTVMFWMDQPENSRKELIRAERDIRDLLLDFVDFIQSNSNFSELRVWGNGATFDNVIVVNACKKLGISHPWGYQNDRCYRTINAIFGNLVENPEDSAIPHHALGDAIWQSEKLVKILNKINGWEK